MNQEQNQLREVVRQIEEYAVRKAPPIFELFASLVAMSISILLFLLVGVFKQDATFYELMRAVLPQTGWAIAFLGVGLISTVGLLLDSIPLRTIALVVMTAMYGLVAAFYIMTFPNLAGILMFWIAVFTVVSIPMVKHTAIRK